jgi:hypothetical protein
MSVQLIPVDKRKRRRFLILAVLELRTSSEKTFIYVILRKLNDVFRNR